VLGDRDLAFQFTSGGEPALDITILRWDPVNDLAAFVDSRKQACSLWFYHPSEEDLTLEGDHKAKAFVCKPQSASRLSLVHDACDRYLQLGGNRDWIC